MQGKRCVVRIWSSVLLICAASLQSMAQANDVDVSAAWKRHEIEFVYMGFTTRYSCEGLRDKMKLLLRTVGARPGFEVATRSCAGPPGRVDPFPHVRMVFEAPEIPAAGRRDVGGPAVARWRPVALSRHQPRELEGGDCELVEQFRSRVLTAFVTRRLEGDINCIPHQLAGSTFNLRFEVLEGLPVAADAADAAAHRR